MFALEVWGLRGRALRLPAESTGLQVPMVLVYGHHASLERVEGLAQVLTQFGPVFVPDLPGFGGMEAFHESGLEPTLDAFADYLAATLRERADRVFGICAVSMGLAIATRMLQRHSDLAERVRVVLSLGGLLGGDELAITGTRRRLFASVAGLFSSKFGACFIRSVFIRPPVIRLAYHLGGGRRSHAKFVGMDAYDYDALLAFEVRLWQINDVRTHFATLRWMLTTFPPGSSLRPVLVHIAAQGDQYIDQRASLARLRSTYTSVRSFVVPGPAHVPTVLASADEFGVLLPVAAAECVAAALRNDSVSTTCASHAGSGCREHGPRSSTRRDP